MAAPEQRRRHSSNSRRGRTRDYTIPVRLNGHQSAAASLASRMAIMRVQVSWVQQQLMGSMGAKRALMPYLLVGLCIIIASVKVEQIHCDSLLVRAPESTKSNAHQASSTKSTGVATAAAAAAAANQSMKQKSGGAIDSSKRQREKLLAKLSENIERQHLKMAASLHQRPSKFDSGDEGQILSGSASYGVATFVATAAPSLKRPSTTKSDDILRDIMRMHEQPAEPAANYHTDRNREKDSRTGNRFFKADAGKPPSAGATLVPLPGRPINRLVAQKLLSYVASPLQLASNKSLAPMRQLAHQLASPVGNVASPFTGRSNAATQSVASPVTPANTDQPRPFLSLPHWMVLRNNRKSAYSTKPSTMFNQHGANWMMSSDQTDNKDLLAESSSLQQSAAISAAGPSSNRPTSSSARQNRRHKDSPASLSLPFFSYDDQSGDHDDGNSNVAATSKGSALGGGGRRPGRWLKNSANQMAQNYLQDSFRGLLTLSQLPILPVGPVSTAPSVLEPRPTQKRQNHYNTNSIKHKQQAASTATGDATTSSSSASATTAASNDKKIGSDRRAKALEDLYRYAYILGTSMRRKRDPLKALSTKTRPRRPITSTSTSTTTATGGQSPASVFFTQRSIGQIAADNRRQMINLVKALQQALFAAAPASSTSIAGKQQQQANPRGVMWDMATDPTLVVTLMHLIERASVALPLGFLLMPVVHMIRNPLSGFDLGRVLPPRALHRSVEHELLAKRLDAVDKVLSRALKPSHRAESFMGMMKKKRRRRRRRKRK